MGYAVKPNNGIVIPLLPGTATVTLTNQPNSEQFLTSTGPYFRFTTTGYKQVRIYTNVSANSASANNPRIYPSYSTDASTWTTIGTGLTTQALLLASPGLKVTDWIDLPSAAVGDIYFRPTMNGGDGVADPAINILGFEFR